MYSKRNTNKRHVHIIGQHFSTQIQATFHEVNSYIYRRKEELGVYKKWRVNWSRKVEF